MSNLEFIEKEIKQLEERKENAFKNEYYSVYKECSQKITALQQIKSELEAWEIAKNKSVDLYDVKTSQDAEEFNCDLYTDYQLTAEEFNKLKKALEVEDEYSKIYDKKD